LTIVFAALAVSRWIEHQTDWSIKKFVRTARRYRAVTIQAGRQTLTAAEPLRWYSAAFIAAPSRSLSFVVPSGRPGMREDRVRSLAEVGGSWRSEPVFEFDPGPMVGLRIVATSTKVRLFPSLFGSARNRVVVVSCVEGVFAMDEVDDADLVVERVAGSGQGWSGGVCAGAAPAAAR
jgi:hypothetical protein